MYPLPKKYFEIYNYARFLRLSDKTVSAADLARYLNRNGIRTDDNQEYDINGRGIYKTISVAYARVNEHLGEAEAAYVAEAFVNEAGKYAYAYYKQHSDEIDAEASAA